MVTSGKGLVAECSTARDRTPGTGVPSRNVRNRPRSEVWRSRPLMGESVVMTSLLDFGE